MTRSTDEWLMSRSCHRATFSSAASAFVRISRARPQTRSASSGLRLCGMPIALHDLGGDGLDAQAERGADLLLEGRLAVRVLAHGPGELADGDGRPGALEPLAVAARLHVPDRRLEAEGRGLGVDAVGAADGQGVLVAHRQ